MSVLGGHFIVDGHPGMTEKVSFENKVDAAQKSLWLALEQPWFRLKCGDSSETFMRQQRLLYLKTKPWEVEHRKSGEDAAEKPEKEPEEERTFGCESNGEMCAVRVRFPEGDLHSQYGLYTSKLMDRLNGKVCMNVGIGI